MPKSLAAYADAAAALKYRNFQRYNNYYGEGRDKRKRARKAWLPIEDKLVREHRMTDRELSKIIKRTVPAIQQRRNELKKQNDE